jgi:hypothetical protein
VKGSLLRPVEEGLHLENLLSQIVVVTNRALQFLLQIAKLVQQILAGWNLSVMSAQGRKLRAELLDLSAELIALPSDQRQLIL